MAPGKAEQSENLLFSPNLGMFGRSGEEITASSNTLLVAGTVWQASVSTSAGWTKTALSRPINNEDTIK
jgi:hypothetical protein